MTVEVEESKITPLRSLYGSTIVRVEPKAEESWSGLTLWVKGFNAKLESNKHVHDLSCMFIEEKGEIKAVCSWKMDGKDMGTLVLSESDPIIRKTIDIVETVWRLRSINGIEVTEPPQVIELRKAVAVIRPIFKIEETSLE